MQRVDRSKEAIKITVVGMAVNFLLVGLKFAAGIFGRSSAMLADAVHSVSDLATDLVVILSFRIVKKPPDKEHQFGHGKFETLASAIVSLMLILVGFGILYSGVKQIISTFNGQVIEKPGDFALYAALVSIIAKEILYHITLRVGRKIDSQTIVANAWHHRSDSLSSLGVLVGIAGAIFLGDDWRILDPLAAVVVSFFIFKVSVSIAKECINELLEGSLSDEKRERIIQLVKSVEGAKNPHELKARKIGNAIAIDIHIEVEPTLTVVEAHDISTKVEIKILEEFGQDSFISIHIEPLKISK